MDEQLDEYIRDNDLKEEDKELLQELMAEMMDFLWGMCRDEAREAEVRTLRSQADVR